MGPDAAAQGACPGTARTISADPVIPGVKIEKAPVLDQAAKEKENARFIAIAQKAGYELLSNGTLVYTGGDKKTVARGFTA